MNSSMKFFNRLFKSIDFFGKPPYLYIGKKKKCKSFFGGLATFCLAGLSIFILINLIIGWFNYSNSTVTKSTSYYSDVELIAKNKSLFYDLTNENYYPYIIMIATLPNGTKLNLTDLKPYFSLNMTYRDEKGIYQPIEIESCYFRKQSEFLKLSKEIIEQDGDYQSHWSVCFKNSQKIGYLSDPNLNQLNASTLNFEIYLCEENCANETEIKSMLLNTALKFYIPKTIYDFSDKDNPSKTLYQKYVYYMDHMNAKRIVNYLLPSNLYKDVGWFDDNYVLDHTNFIVERQEFDLYSKQSKEAMFSFIVLLSDTVENIYIRNQKLNELFGTFGGILSLLVKIFSFICLFYNSHKYKQKIVKSSFGTSIAANNEKKDYENNKNKYRFFLFKYLSKCCFKRENAPENHLKRHIYEYIDIKNLIKRLQEIENIKNILFDNEQIKLFKMIPKPDLSQAKKIKINKNGKKETLIEIMKNIHQTPDYSSNFSFLITQRLLGLNESENSCFQYSPQKKISSSSSLEIEISHHVKEG